MTSGIFLFDFEFFNELETEQGAWRANRERELPRGSVQLPVSGNRERGTPNRKRELPNRERGSIFGGVGVQK